MTKTCPACKVEQPISGFYADSRTKDGLTSWCKKCRRVYEINNRDKARANSKRWRENNLDAAHAAERKSRIKKVYGLSLEQYNDIVIKQASACAICGLVPKILVIDHCHGNKKVRGLLCATCNTGIGHLRDDPKLLISALNYLTQGKSPEGFDITVLNNDLAQLK